MKKIFLLFALITLVVPLFVFAKPDIGTTQAKEVALNSGFDDATEYSLSQNLGRYVKVALSLVGTIFLLLVVYAGFLWMTASGNEEQVTKATDIVKMATLGLVIVLASYSITVFVLSSVGMSTQAPNLVDGQNQAQQANKCDGIFDLDCYQVD